MRGGVIAFVAGAGLCVVVALAAAGIVAMVVRGEPGDRVERIGLLGEWRRGRCGAWRLVAGRFRCAGAHAFAQALKKGGLAAQLRGRHLGCGVGVRGRRRDDAGAMRG
ncbi:hypothetical protein [Burkholderia cenocepacia]|uniref:hypothetical protein n=1 Tax=Burkholderia cenocepacia TaxID=95486 RepID=UPI001F49FB79|nr:hypothetical protein [Burkholderia cenocepacia]